MAEKQILVVDDHFEMLELLRSMLEVSGHDFEVRAVPSAELAMMELPRTQFDLLITDVRLPGMSGFDFVRWLRRRKSEIPVIMITAYSSPQGQKEAEELGIYRYFRKPLDADAMITAVQNALFGEPEEVPTPPQKVMVSYTVPENVHRRLQSLRADTGATGLVLATIHGQILLELGDSRGLDLQALIQVIAKNIKNSFTLAEGLQENAPFTIQYHGGRSTELYNANVGQDYFVSIFYNAEARRGRIGTIWVFAQRAIRDLTSMLPPLKQLSASQAASAAEATAAPPHPAPSRTEPLPASPRQPEPPREAAPAAVPPPPVVEEEPDMEGLLEALNLDKTAVPSDVDSFWDDALSQGDETGATSGTISFTEAASLVEGLPDLMTPDDAAETEAEQAEDDAEADISGLLEVLNLADQDPGSVDLDAFWDDAMSDKDNSDIDGLTYAEAKRRGLIPSEMEESDDGS